MHPRSRRHLVCHSRLGVLEEDALDGDDPALRKGNLERCRKGEEPEQARSRCNFEGRVSEEDRLGRYN